MKKQFFRVKQLADQTFSRAGKTETLSDDLVSAEKRIEFLNKVCQNVSKKVVSTLLGQGQDASTDKRLKKSPEYLLAVMLFDSSNAEVDDILKQILIESSSIQLRLAEASVDNDVRVETKVLVPLQHIIDNDIPNVMKQKRNLSRLILDMDSAKNRYQTALKSSTSTGNATKVDSIKEELEELEMKVEQCRDALACDMFQLISKEAVLATVLLDYVKLQQAAHRSALAILDSLVPDLQSTIENSSIKAVFGSPLEDHLRVTGRKIAYPLELCVCAILELGMEEGIFRIGGGASKIRRLKAALDVNYITIETAMEYRDVHVISNVLKMYFRELPEPLLTYALYEEWLSSIGFYDHENDKLAALWEVLHKLPTANFDNLRYFIKFLVILTKNQEVTKMSPQNLGIVIAPNLIWSHNNSNDASTGEFPINKMQDDIVLVHQYSGIVEYLIKHADWFFPGDETFYLSIEEATSRTKKHTRSNSADIRLLNTELTTSPDSLSIKRCQSTTSLEEQIQSCPLPESPKPITRTRKNKPAPIPPVSNIAPSSPSGSGAQKDKNVNKTSSVTPIKNHLSNESSPTNVTHIPTHQESFSFKDLSEKLDGVQGEDKDEKSSSKSPKVKITGDGAYNVSPDVSKVLSVESLNMILESSKKITKPVPAPRISLERSTNDDAIPKKPIVPEKPTSLQRPMSCTFKSFKIGDIQDIKSEGDKHKGPSLEKAHLYSVDKQQVSFIEIASSPDGSSPSEPTPPEHSSLRSRSSFSSSDKVMGEKRDNYKPELRSDSGQNSSHTRALSDGHNIDVTAGNLPPHHRNMHRVHVQRPIPPPPPPPVISKTQVRSGSISDSTNL